MLRLIKWQMKDALHILIIGNHSLHRFNLESTESDRRVGRRHSLQSVLFMEPLNGFHSSREIKPLWTSHVRAAWEMWASSLRCMQLPKALSS